MWYRLSSVILGLRNSRKVFNPSSSEVYLLTRLDADALYIEENLV